MTNKTNPVVWFEIYVDDIDRATKFYEEVLQTKLEETPETDNGEGFKMKVFHENSPEIYGAHGALVQMKGFSAGRNSTLVYFGSEDCAVEQSRVENAGGKIIKPKTSIGPNGFISICQDTEGNMFGLHSMA